MTQPEPAPADADVDVDVPFVSVVVPVHDDSARLRTCLAALAGQSYAPDRFEVVVVDNASREDVRASVPDDGRFRLFREPRPGSYAARNHGLAQARGTVLAFTDSDCVPGRDWLSAGVHALSQPGVEAVGGHIDLTFRAAAPATAAELYEAVEGFPQRRYVEEMSFAATANLFTTREAFDRVGPFDARLRSGGDVDWGKRLTALGAHLVYSPAPVVAHPARHSLAQLRAKAVRVAQGVADRTQGTPRSVVLRRAAHDVRSAATVWVRVWRMAEPARVQDKARYATAVSYVKLVRAVIAVRTATAVRGR